MESMSVSGGSIQKQKQKTRVRIGRRTLAVIAIALAASVGLTAFALYPRPDVVRIDGSSTVFPITVAWAQNFSRSKSGSFSISLCFSFSLIGGSSIAEGHHPSQRTIG